MSARATNTSLTAILNIPPLKYSIIYPPCKATRIPESFKFLLVESGIRGFGIRNTAQRIRNPTKDWNPESKFHWEDQNPESTVGIHNPRQS